MGIGFGDHVCSIFQNSEQQFSLVIPFIMEGLEKNQKCVYVVDDNSREGVMAEFAKAGFEIKKYIDSKQFLLLLKSEAYLKDGCFDAAKMTVLVQEILDDALGEGYEGVRGTGEMTWTLGNMSYTDELISYEVKLNDFIKSKKIALICQYDENKFSQEILVDIIRTHTWVIVRGKMYENKYFFTPPEYMKGEGKTFPAASYKIMIDSIVEG
jgi:HTH-type transcriptional regulator, bacterioopsin transcriptional activator and related proteins